MKGGDIMKTTIASLKCVQCENSFPFNLNEKPSHITCPFCQTEVANDMIEQIYDAANTVGEVNKISEATQTSIPTLFLNCQLRKRKSLCQLIIISYIF